MNSQIPFKKNELNIMNTQSTKPVKKSELYQLLKSLDLIKPTEYKKATV